MEPSMSDWNRFTKKTCNTSQYMQILELGHQQMFQVCSESSSTHFLLDDWTDERRCVRTLLVEREYKECCEKNQQSARPLKKVGRLYCKALSQWLLTENHGAFSGAVMRHQILCKAWMSIRMIADELSISQIEVFDIVTETLAMRKECARSLCAKFVPRVLYSTIRQRCLIPPTAPT
ncbi:hypothetical protein TNCV_643881 [Trichonephila clavipes]|nr:hypothetical protein TNCV_643881 [Trichonephila clavipes]